MHINVATETLDLLPPSIF